MISLPTLLDFTIRLTVILSMGLVGMAILVRASAGERHGILLASLIAALLLPLGLLVAPKLPVAILPSDSIVLLTAATFLKETVPPSSKWKPPSHSSPGQLPLYRGATIS